MQVETSTAPVWAFDDDFTTTKWHHIETNPYHRKCSETQQTTKDRLPYDFSYNLGDSEVCFNVYRAIRVVSKHPGAFAVLMPDERRKLKPVISGSFDTGESEINFGERGLPLAPFFYSYMPNKNALVLAVSCEEEPEILHGVRNFHAIHFPGAAFGGPRKDRGCSDLREWAFDIRVQGVPFSLTFTPFYVLSRVRPQKLPRERLQAMESLISARPRPEREERSVRVIIPIKNSECAYDISKTDDCVRPYYWIRVVGAFNKYGVRPVKEPSLFVGSEDPDGRYDWRGPCWESM